MRIIETSNSEMDKRTVFKMTKGKDTINARTMPDREIFTAQEYLIYQEENSKGEEVEILAILTEDGRVICAQSNTFKNSFLEVWEAFGRGCECMKISGESKSGREYIDCTLY